MTLAGACVSGRACVDVLPDRGLHLRQASGVRGVVGLVDELAGEVVEFGEGGVVAVVADVLEAAVGGGDEVE